MHFHRTQASEIEILLGLGLTGGIETRGTNPTPTCKARTRDPNSAYHQKTPLDIPTTHTASQNQDPRKGLYQFPFIFRDSQIILD